MGGVAFRAGAVAAVQPYSAVDATWGTDVGYWQATGGSVSGTWTPLAPVVPTDTTWQWTLPDDCTSGTAAVQFDGSLSTLRSLCIGIGLVTPPDTETTFRLTLTLLNPDAFDRPAVFGTGAVDPSLTGNVWTVTYDDVSVFITFTAEAVATPTCLALQLERAADVDLSAFSGCVIHLWQDEEPATAAALQFVKLSIASGAAPHRCLPAQEVTMCGGTCTWSLPPYVPAAVRQWTVRNMRAPFQTVQVPAYQAPESFVLDDTPSALLVPCGGCAVLPSVTGAPLPPS